MSFNSSSFSDFNNSRQASEFFRKNHKPAAKRYKEQKARKQGRSRVVAQDESIMNLASPPKVYAKVVTTGESLSYVDLHIRKGQLGPPGPGRYSSPSMPLPKGGVISAGNPKSDVEWEILRAANIPGPGEYGALSPPAPKGGKFNLSCPKDDVEWQMYRAAQQPGPGAYSLPEIALSGGKFNTSNSKSDVEWKMHDAKSKPGPADYTLPDETKRLPGGRFNLSQPKSELEWIEHNERQKPGPGSYDAPTAQVSGGKFNLSDAKDDVEWLMYRAAQQPGPGQYEGRVAINKALPFRLARPATSVALRAMAISAV
jgi:hypothetical protein